MNKLRPRCECVGSTRPRHHRVHHASPAVPGPELRGHPHRLGPAPRHLHRRGEPPVYGLTKNIATYNPLRVATHEYASLAHDLAAAGTWKDRVSHLVRGPGWRPEPAAGAGAVPAGVATSADLPAEDAGTADPARPAAPLAGESAA